VFISGAKVGGCPYARLQCAKVYFKHTWPLYWNYYTNMKQWIFCGKDQLEENNWQFTAEILMKFTIICVCITKTTSIFITSC